jgi:hypothetical protein
MTAGNPTVQGWWVDNDEWQNNMDNREMVPRYHCPSSLTSHAREVFCSLPMFRLVSSPPPPLKIPNGKGIFFSSHVHNVVRLIKYVFLILGFWLPCANELMRGGSYI